MSDQPNDGGPAFPHRPMSDAQGMSLRDWFAGHFAAAMMGGLLSSGGRAKKGEERVVADAAYILADAMLAARNGGGK